MTFENGVLEMRSACALGAGGLIREDEIRQKLMEKIWGIGSAIRGSHRARVSRRSLNPWMVRAMWALQEVL